jgi:hypothetical protein
MALARRKFGAPIGKQAFFGKRGMARFFHERSLKAQGAPKQFFNEEAVMKKIISTALIAAFVAGSGLAFAAEVDQRLENQGDRIQQGEKSGELTNKEAHTLKKDDRKIRKEIRHDRKENGGNLTNKEKAKINRQENHVSKKIYRKKHNDVKKPGAN